MSVLTLDDVSARLGGHLVLDGLSLQVATGEWVNIIGPNGAGKTTLLRAILGATPVSGGIRITGLDQVDPRSRSRAIAYVAQTPVVPPGILVADYVMLGRTPHRGAFAANTDDDRDVVQGVLHRLDLASFADRAVSSLSGGERQRAVLARALAQQARILLLDEPTTALDLGHQQEVLDLVELLRREDGLTVITTLHDLTLAARYGDRVALLSGGKVAIEGPPRDVLTEAVILEHFRARVRVLDDIDGPVIVPAVPEPRLLTP